MREIRLNVPEDTVAITMTFIARHDMHPTMGNVINICTHTIELNRGQDEIRMDYDPSKGFSNIRSFNSKTAELPFVSSDMTNGKDDAQ